MLEQEKFNGRVLIFPLLEIDFLKTSINLKEADVLVVTSVYALEKQKIEFLLSITTINDHDCMAAAS